MSLFSMPSKACVAPTCLLPHLLHTLLSFSCIISGTSRYILYHVHPGPIRDMEFQRQSIQPSFHLSW